MVKNKKTGRPDMLLVVGAIVIISIIIFSQQFGLSDSADFAISMDCNHIEGNSCDEDDYKNIYDIAGQSLNIGIPQLVCNKNKDFISTDEPECVQTTISFMDNDYIVSGDDTIDIGFFTIKYSGVAEWERDDETDILEFDSFNHNIELYFNRDAIEIQEINTETIGLDDYGVMELIINNKIVDDLGITINNKFSQTFFLRETFTDDFIFLDKGKNEYYPEIVTDNIGKVKVKSIIFLNVEEKQIQL